MKRASAVGTIFALWASGLAAEVKVVVRPDGHKVIVNEGPLDRARRFAARLLDPPRLELADLIDRYSSDARLDPKLVRAVVQVESGYNTQALSDKGAMGLMQLMPDTARLFAVADPYNAEQNLHGGTSYLRRLLDLFDERLELALAAYNAGPGAVQSHGGIPPYDETVAYVRQILSLYRGEDNAGLTVGRKVFITRGPDNRILLTTTPTPR